MQSIGGGVYSDTTLYKVVEVARDFTQKNHQLNVLYLWLQLGI